MTKAIIGLMLCCVACGSAEGREPLGSGSSPQELAGGGMGGQGVVSLDKATGGTAPRLPLRPPDSIIWQPRPDTSTVPCPNWGGQSMLMRGYPVPLTPADAAAGIWACAPLCTVPEGATEAPEPMRQALCESWGAQCKIINTIDVCVP